MTIRVLGLDRNALLDLYQAHARAIRPALRRLRRSSRVRSGDFEERWHQQCEVGLSPFSPFPALTYDLLDHAVPATLRRHLEVELPYPPYTPG